MPTIPFIPTSLPLRYTDLRPSPRSSAGGGLIIPLRERSDRMGEGPRAQRTGEWVMQVEASRRGGLCTAVHLRRPCHCLSPLIQAPGVGQVIVLEEYLGLLSQQRCKG